MPASSTDIIAELHAQASPLEQGIDLLGFSLFLVVPGEAIMTTL